ncbi:DUF1648 domain-containing protein [Streptomyces sp. NPDC047072]|uniref:DUF1648 domain-containing protein n=1 Tax=Streptomyces sp. NPDC047072 TaxID=3154809 RepID=UPI0033EF35DB
MLSKGALVVVVALSVVLRGRTPGRMAVHFALGGEADRFAGRGVFVASSVLVLAVAAATMAVVLGRARIGRVRLLVSAYAIAGFVGSVLVSVQVVNVSDDVSAVRLPVWHLAVALGVAVVAAGVGRLAARALGPLPPLPSVTEERARLALADGELAAWAHATGSRPLGAVGLTLTAVSLAVFPFAGLPVFCALLLAGALCLAFARLYVTVGRQGLTVTPGRLPWPRIHVPLESMTDAPSRSVDAIGEFGGWGYRIRPGASGVILHSGPALVVRRTGGRAFAVTVDDAATAAALLNTLIARRKAH